MSFPSPGVCKHSPCPRCAVLNKVCYPVPSVESWDCHHLAITDGEGNHSLLHIHADERKAIFMAHAWRPHAAWHLSSRTLRETETEKRGDA